jgi:hypothetical protein
VPGPPVGERSPTGGQGYGAFLNGRSCGRAAVSWVGWDGCVGAHWEIENRLHWVRDVTFAEDHGQIRTGLLVYRVFYLVYYR